jgi:hypothetical protein
MPVRQEAKVPNADEARRKDMQEKSAQELMGGKSHLPFLIAVCVVLPAEAHLVAIETEQPMVADRNAMGIASEVMQDVFRAAEGRLGIDDPILSTQLVQKSSKLIGIIKVLQASTEDELTLLKGDFQAFSELAAENPTEYPDRKEKVLPARLFPGGPVQCQTAGGNDAMNVWVMQQVLPPRMKDAEKPDVRSQVFRVGSNLE